VKRRDLLSLVGGAAAAGALPIAVGAQAQQTMPVIGYLSGLSAGDRPVLRDAFHKGLSEGGYIAGRNITIEYRYADNRVERSRKHAAELVSRKVSVIVVTGGPSAILAVKRLTSSIPILFTSGADPVQAGIVTSLSRPDGNLTGISFFAAHVSPKQMELFREFLPRVAVIGLILRPDTTDSHVAEPLTHEAARALGLRLVVVKAATPMEIDAAIARLAQEKVDAAIVGADPFYTSRATQFIALGTQHRIPLAYANREFVEAGGLLSYGNNISDAYQRLGVLTSRVLKGAKPIDLPIDRAVKFELVVNLKAAKALGLTFPHSLLSRADEVID
jgi:putative ABC transport system substrate-binding protein